MTQLWHQLTCAEGAEAGVGEGVGLGGRGGSGKGWRGGRDGGLGVGGRGIFSWSSRWGIIIAKPLSGGFYACLPSY